MRPDSKRLYGSASHFNRERKFMVYRIMQIGDKYAAQLVDANGKPGDFISHDSTGTWSSPQYVVSHCLTDTAKTADDIGRAYVLPRMDAAELLASAREVTL